MIKITAPIRVLDVEDFLKAVMFYDINDQEGVRALLKSKNDVQRYDLEIFVTIISGRTIPSEQGG